MPMATNSNSAEYQQQQQENRCDGDDDDDNLDPCSIGCQTCFGKNNAGCQSQSTVDCRLSPAILIFCFFLIFVFASCNRLLAPFCRLLLNKMTFNPFRIAFDVSWPQSSAPIHPKRGSEEMPNEIQTGVQLQRRRPGH